MLICLCAFVVAWACHSGEPLKNYDQVLSAIRAMTDGNRFGLAPSRITLSTVGVIPRMLDLTRDIPAIQLALSLHAPTQALRQQIVPTAKAWPIDKLIEAADYFIQRSKKRILVEYVLLDGVNASDKEAHELGKLLQGKDVVSRHHGGTARRAALQQQQQQQPRLVDGDLERFPPQQQGLWLERISHDRDTS